MTNREKIIIAGPCAVESEDQVRQCVTALKQRGIEKMRAPLWKPRTRPSKFEGVADKGLPWLAEATKTGITVGTEVLLADQVTKLTEGIYNYGGDPSRLFFWLGSRNQNQSIQREIAKRIQAETPGKVKLLIKNQPWGDEAHWLGIVEYVTEAGLELERVILCHRGFSPSYRDNPDSLKNIPDWEMAMQVRETTGLPMLLDPSHIGGRTEKVIRVVEMSARYDFDGLMIEVHPDPPTARTDSGQQLSFEELDKILAIKNMNKGKKSD